MNKVKEFLDKVAVPQEEGSVTDKANGHYQVFGLWTHSKGNSQIRCNINNETIQINIIIDGSPVGPYSYLQTYDHIPRGEADKYGYHARSTGAEIIKYLKEYYFDKI
jgi:hypothetical protein